MKTQIIQIAAIDWEFWPRLEPNQFQIDLYRSSLENLPPISVNQNMKGIDGYHRCQAFRQEGYSEIEVIIEDISNDQVLIESIKRNAIHGLQLSNKDKRRNAVLLYEAELSVDEITQLLSVHRNSVLNWTEDARKEKRTEEDRIIWDMWLACTTQEEIAGKLELAQKTISDRLSNLHKNVENTSPIPLKTFNLWSFPSCDERYGFKYPGRIPGQIIEHLLYYYTKPFDVVWDLFGGSGTTIDVCKLYARRYQVFDLVPARDDICQWDITKGMPEIRSHCKPSFIFLDPPYGPQKQGEYSDDPTNLANLETFEFHEQLSSIVKQSIKIVSVTALIIGATQSKEERIDHASEIVNQVGIPQERIIVPYPTEQYGGAQVKQAKEGKFMWNLYRDLMIWKK